MQPSIATLTEPTAISGRAVARLTSGAPIVGIVPTTIEEAFRLAELIKQSGLAPYQLKTPQAVTVVLLKGLEIGLPPMAALECIGVINNKACLHSDGIPALLWSRGFKIREWYEGSGDALTAKCLITRPDGIEYPGEFSTQDAKDAGLWDTRERVKRKVGDDWKEVANDAPWFRYRKRMLKMRCRGWTARDAASDVLKGIPIFEEQNDIELSRSEYRETHATKALPDLPDLPDMPDALPELPAEGVGDEPLADPVGFLAKLKEERGYCQSESDVEELREANASLIARLSPKDQIAAHGIMSVEEDA